MANTVKFKLAFRLPDGNHDPCTLSDAVFAAGYEDALVGTGINGLIVVEFEVDGDDVTLIEVERAILDRLPDGSKAVFTSSLITSTPPAYSHQAPT